MNPKEYELNFTIPAGATGPEGPTGPTGATGPTGNADKSAAIGLISYYLPQNGTFLVSRNPYTLNLPMVGWGYNVDYNTKNYIIIKKAGGYKVDYGVTITVPAASPTNIYSVTVCPSFNDKGIIGWRSVQISIDSSNIYYFHGSCLYDFDENENVCLVISSDKVTDFNYSNAFLVANRITDEFTTSNTEIEEKA